MELRTPSNTLGHSILVLARLLAQLGHSGLSRMRMGVQLSHGWAMYSILYRGRFDAGNEEVRPGFLLRCQI